MTKTRQAAVAGQFYPGSAAEINEMFSEFFKKVGEDEKFTELKQKILKNKVHGIIVPHAGWVYSGGVAAYAYDLVKDYCTKNNQKNKNNLNNKNKFKKIILLGPNHTIYLNQAALDENDEWETPLGKVKIMDVERKKLLENTNLFTAIGGAHKKEHDLEVQVPFLQHIFDEEQGSEKKNDNIDEFTLLPIIVGDVGTIGAEEVAKKLLKIYNDAPDETLFVISTDLSHYQPQETAEKLDFNTIKIIEELNIDEAHMLDACGKNPLLVTMFLCKMLKVKPIMLKYATSGDVSGDYNGVVGYVSMVF